MTVLFPLRASNRPEAIAQATQEEGWKEIGRGFIEKDGQRASIGWIKEPYWSYFAIIAA